ncbi:hypothetical protein FP744_10001146 [Trichoderma asperellum]
MILFTIPLAEKTAKKHLSRLALPFMKRRLEIPTPARDLAGLQLYQGNSRATIAKVSPDMAEDLTILRNSLIRLQDFNAFGLEDQSAQIRVKRIINAFDGVLTKLRPGRLPFAMVEYVTQLERDSTPDNVIDLAQ